VSVIDPAELAWLAKGVDLNSTSCGSFGISTQSLCSRSLLGYNRAADSYGSP
jgi:hypothetical protein